MSDFDHRPRIEDLALTRRELLGKMGNGMAALGLVSMLGGDGMLGQASASPLRAANNLNPLAPKPSQFAPKAKRV